MFTAFAWAVPPLALVPLCLRKSPSPLIHCNQTLRAGRDDAWVTEHCNLKWGSRYYYYCCCYYFRQALPIQPQNTSASPCQGRAGLAFEKLLCPSAETDEQNIIETEQKQATTNKWKDSMLVLFGGWHEDKVWVLCGSTMASTEGYFCVPFCLGNGASPIALSFLVHAACWCRAGCVFWLLRWELKFLSKGFGVGEVPRKNHPNWGLL